MFYGLRAMFWLRLSVVLWLLMPRSYRLRGRFSPYLWAAGRAWWFSTLADDPLFGYRFLSLGL